MKFTTISAMFILIFLSAFTPRTVIAPEYESGPFTFRIASVHLCDTATVIEACLYGAPNSHTVVNSVYHLTGASTGKIYPLRRIEGSPVKTPVSYGDSCHIRASLVFDPLEAADTIFDFIEGDSNSDGSYNIYGLNLNPEPGKIRTIISGTVDTSRLNDWLILSSYGADERVDKTTIIPVENGTFRYVLHTSDTLAFDLISGLERLRGSWTNHYFFAEGTPVNIKSIGDDDPFWNKTEGGTLTTNLSGSYKLLQDIIDNSGINGDPHVPKQKIDSVLNLTKDYKRSLIKTDTTLIGLLWIYDEIFKNGPDQESVFAIFRDRYASRFPDHPYTAEIIQQMNGDRVERGSKYPDFSAPDLTGNMQTLSELIKGKFAVIDLWASWCGPCRRHSMELIPIYEKWKDKGFTIVGVARERGNATAMEKAIIKDGYPWINLVELNDQGKIWHKYQAGNRGGKIVFVSPEGKILGIDPQASDIEAILEVLLKDK